MYFNAYIPDPQLTATETDGLFAFVGYFRGRGTQALRVMKEGEYLSTQVLPVENNYISYVGVEIGDRRSRVWPFTMGTLGRPFKAGVEIYGSEKVIDVVSTKEKEEAIYFPGGKGLMVLEVDARGRLRCFQTQCSSATKVH